MDTPAKTKRRNGYKGRVMKPAHRHTAGFKAPTVIIGRRDFQAGFDYFWSSRGCDGSIGNMQLCEG